MSIWALLDGGKEVAAYRGIDCDENREACIKEAKQRGLAVELMGRLAMVDGVEVVRRQ